MGSANLITTLRRVIPGMISNAVVICIQPQRLPESWEASCAVYTDSIEIQTAFAPEDSVTHPELANTVTDALSAKPPDSQHIPNDFYGLIFAEKCERVVASGNQLLGATLGAMIGPYGAPISIPDSKKGWTYGLFRKGSMDATGILNDRSYAWIFKRAAKLNVYSSIEQLDMPRGAIARLHNANLDQIGALIISFLTERLIESPGINKKTVAEVEDALLKFGFLRH